MSLENFISKIDGFNNFSASDKIDYFIYYHTIIKENEGANCKEINSYYEELKIVKYSNVSQYLKINSKKTKGKSPKYILSKRFYHLERNRKAEIDTILELPKFIPATNNYFPLELFENTRDYLKKIAYQSASCYDNGLFDACSVMTRKLLEVLIIESFERYGISEKLKSTNGNFLYLSDLIDLFKTEQKWNIGRNAKQSIPNLKKMGDLSAHNRRFIARKPDLDKIKDDLRIVLEELIHIIDYPNWGTK